MPIDPGDDIPRCTSIVRAHYLWQILDSRRNCDWAAVYRKSWGRCCVTRQDSQRVDVAVAIATIRPSNKRTIAREYSNVGGFPVHLRRIWPTEQFPVVAQ